MPEFAEQPAPNDGLATGPFGFEAFCLGLVQNQRPGEFSEAGRRDREVPMYGPNTGSPGVNPIQLRHNEPEVALGSRLAMHFQRSPILIEWCRHMKHELSAGNRLALLVDDFAL